LGLIDRSLVTNEFFSRFVEDTEYVTERNISSGHNLPTITFLQEVHRRFSSFHMIQEDASV